MFLASVLAIKIHHFEKKQVILGYRKKVLVHHVNDYLSSTRVSR